MKLTGIVKSYSPHLLYGYLALDGYKDVIFYLKDLPHNDIQPHIGEQFQFQVFEVKGRLVARQIQRIGLEREVNWKQRVKTYAYSQWVDFVSASNAQQRWIIAGVLSCSLLLVALSIVGFHDLYQQYQIQKSQAYMQLQQNQIAQQRALHGDLPEEVLSEEARRNLDGKVYGTAKPRAENVSHSIDKLNGRLPVSAGKFKCDGRVYCSEMRSYEEAIYFHRYCRGTKLDGNGNGKICENDMRWQ